MSTTIPPVLIEDWLPIDKVGAESLRDASAARKPPLNRLHVWWAHQAKKNAAASTILLVCRKREQDDEEEIWWDDIRGRVRRVAREKAQAYLKQGISGVDLYISTFCPTMSVISEQLPVFTIELMSKQASRSPCGPKSRFTWRVKRSFACVKKAYWQVKPSSLIPLPTGISWRGTRI